MVVDYALASAPVLRKVLVKLLDRPSGADRLRILLLERQADARDGWLAKLSSARSDREYGLGELFDAGGPIPLAPLAAGEVAAALVHGAAAAAVGLPDARPGLDAAELARHVLASAAGHTPLDLLMAVIVAADTGDPARAGAGRTELAGHLAGRELARIRALAGHDTVAGEFLEHLAVVLTLQGGAARDALEELAVEEWQALQRQGPFDKERTARLLVDALPAGDGGAAPILPDLIGEAALLEGLAGRAPATQAAIIGRAFARAPAATAQAVVRSVQDFVHRDEAPLAWVDTLLKRADDPAQLFVLANVLPVDTVALRKNAAEVLGRLAELYRRSVEDGNAEARGQLAMYLNDAAIRLDNIGRHHEALQAAEEAVAIWRDLSNEEPGTFRLQLTMSLNALGIVLASLGRHSDALRATDEAVLLCCPFAIVNPAALHPELAMSFNNRAGRLLSLGKPQEAHDATSAAVQLYRALAAIRPAAFGHRLARSLNNLALAQEELGALADALATNQAVVELWSDLADARPDAFRPELATSLTTRARLLSQLDNHQEALAKSDEAIAHWRALADAEPSAFRGHLAHGHWVRGGVLLNAGESSLAAASFADGIRELRKFGRVPVAHNELMHTLAGSYRVACGDAGIEPDESLVAAAEDD